MRESCGYVARPAGLSQGRSRIVARSPVTGFTQTRRPLSVCDPAGRAGLGDSCERVSHGGCVVGKPYLGITFRLPVIQQFDR